MIYKIKCPKCEADIEIVDEECIICGNQGVYQWEQNKHWSTDYRHVPCGATIKFCDSCRTFSKVLATTQPVHSDITACWHWHCYNCHETEREERRLRDR